MANGTDSIDALRRSEAYLAQAQSLSHTGGFGWNARSGKIFWSAETFRIFEMDPASQPDIATILERTHPQDRNLVERAMDRARSEQKDFQLEHRLVMADGSIKHLQVVAQARVNESGDTEFVGAVMDITERKSAEASQRAQEREREEMHRQLQRAAKMEALGHFAAGIAHDFNNILGAILGYGELAQDCLRQDSVVRRHVDRVIQAGLRGKGLVERILTFSLSEIVEYAPLAVQPIVAEALDLITPSVPVDVRVERQLDAASATVVGDVIQLHQLTMNLCTNAVHAMEQGGVLKVMLERQTVEEHRSLSHGVLKAGRYVRLSVSDTGSGITPAVLERMFDPFVTTKRGGEGTGLGLALVHGIVGGFGGAIDVATQLGVGSTFMIWLPDAGEMPMRRAAPAEELPGGLRLDGDARGRGARAACSRGACWTPGEGKAHQPPVSIPSVRPREDFAGGLKRV